jgi:PadR family transcriptional regulator, regulatory protein PadR
MAFKGNLEGLVLGVLQDRTAHGYDIAKQIAKQTDKLVTVGEGQLYPALHRMEDAGLIAATWVPQAGKPDRKVNEITPKGREELVRQRSAWEKLASGVGSIMAGKNCAEGNRG